MKKILPLLFLFPLLTFGHSSQLSTFALVKDANGTWTAHVSASFEAFEMVLEKNKTRSAREFQEELIERIKNSIQIRLGLFKSVTLSNGQLHLGHQSDVKFLVHGLSEQVETLAIQNQIFKNHNNHFVVFKVINDTVESNQVVLNSLNDFSATVDLMPTRIVVKSASAFPSNYYYLSLLIIPIMLLFSFIYSKRKILSLVALAILSFSCSEDDNPTTTPTVDATVPEVYKKIYGASSITSDGTYITIKTKGVPDHKSPYYATTNSLYQAYSGTTFGGLNFSKNPNTIVEQSGTFKIPVNPKVASTHAATPLGPIGIAINGVPFFNQYAGPNNQELTGEMASFDQFYGHPQQSGMYHYHVEPLHLTTVKSTKSGLMGFLLDGFPVYGPQEENGTTVSNSNLDVYHGHTHSTLDFPSGIYHYHLTGTAPYLNGNGFYGTPGTVSQ